MNSENYNLQENFINKQKILSLKNFTNSYENNKLNNHNICIINNLKNFSNHIENNNICIINNLKNFNQYGGKGKGKSFFKKATEI